MKSHAWFRILWMAAGPGAWLPAQGATTLRAVETLRLGEARGAEYAFDFPRIAVGPRGEMAVRRHGEKRIDIYDSTGALLRRIGREGKGPGEFSSIVDIRWINDTIFVRDWNDYRITAFRADGRVAWVRRIPDAPRSSDWTIYDEPQILANGLLLSDRIPNRAFRGDLPIVLTDTSGKLYREVARLIDGPELLPLRGRISLGYQPWGDRSLWAARTDGKGFVLVDRKVSKKARQFRVRSYDQDGDLLFDRMYAYAPVPIDKREVDSVVAVAKGKWFGEGIGPGIAAGLPVVPNDAFAKGLYVPAHRPPVTAVVAARDGSIWVRREERGRTVQWEVLDRTGVIIGTIVLPTDLTLYDADAAHIWGIERIEFGVEEVVRYSIVR